MSKKITIQGLEIAIKQVEKEDYIALTDMARKRENQEPNAIIRNWLRNSSTIIFLEAWEKYHNPDFKPSQMRQFRDFAFDQRNLITIKRYLDLTQAIGIQSKSGRYGGTFAHVDIAFEFASWLDPEFKLFVIKDYQRLKEAERQQLDSTWTFSRFLSKINYTIHTEAIKENLLPRIDPAKRETYVFASEADLLNVAVFGMSAREWRETYPESAKKGNMRDFASLEELTVLSNLESLNAYLIERGASQAARFDALAATAQTQMIILRDHQLLPGKD